MSDWDGVRSKCSILNGQVICIEKAKLDIADMTNSTWSCHNLNVYIWGIPNKNVSTIFDISMSSIGVLRISQWV